MSDSTATLSMRVRWLLLAVVASGLLSIAAFDQSEMTDDERVEAMTSRFACPQCDGQSVAESNAAVAATIRDYIRVQVAAGATDEEIRDQLIVSYGSGVLLNPPADGVSALIWVLPVLVLVGGTTALVVSVRRSDLGDGRATAADTELVADALAGGSDDG